MNLAEAHGGRVYIARVESMSPELATQLSLDLLVAADAARAQREHAEGRVPEPRGEATVRGHYRKRKSS